MFSPKVVNILLLTLLFVISLLPRAYQLDATEIYPDEITWTARSRESFLALKVGNPYYFKDGWWKSTQDTEAINLPTAVISGASIFFLAKNQPTHYSLNLFPDYIAARIPIVLINSAFIVLFYLIVRKITQNQKAALLGSLIFSLDPIYLGLSRWVIADTFLGIWIFLSLSSYLLIKKKALSILVASLFLSLAFLTKPSALILLPVFFVCSPLKSVFTFFVFAFFTHLLWVGSTGKIAWEILEYTLAQYHLAQEPFTVFFAGDITTNPPLYYYLQQLILRLPLLTLAGVVLFFISGETNLFIHRKAFSKKILFSVLLFVFLYLLAMSLSTKKLGIRYIFPIIPWVYLLAAIQLSAISDKLNKKVKLLYFGAIGAYLVGTILYYFPNYSLYYNQLAGSPENAQKIDLPGLCMGARDSVLYLEKYHAASSVAYMGCAKTIIPYYSSIVITTNWENEEFVIIEASYKALSPNDPAVLYFAEKEPLHVNSKKGFILARTYLNK